MKLISIILLVFGLSVARAEEKIKMYFNNEELTKIIEIYSKASGQKFLLDPSVRGRVSIFIQEPVALEEAFNQVSSALAVNGLAISKQGDTMVVKSARNIQRDLIEVSSQRPTLKPERMYTWVYTVKHLPANSINRDLRILTSKDGELAVNEKTNQLLISDWASNLNRIAEILKEVDKPIDPPTAKLVEMSKKDREMYRKEPSERKTEKKEKTDN